MPASLNNRQNIRAMVRGDEMPHPRHTRRVVRRTATRRAAVLAHLAGKI